jgi:hypothetical protein
MVVIRAWEEWGRGRDRERLINKYILVYEVLVHFFTAR